ncbi:hypothetical protein [Streptosporangium sp. 'caverna']|uniref:hypothetical protein n=1 Tax=Streptosporangium sp. 'caverna' TaxID=2202249 RepID=UPI0013A6F283|nr:hypothetical protein [Streptosporangium sp. 'caverna']
MHIFDDPSVSPRVRNLLLTYGKRITATPTEQIKALGCSVDQTGTSVPIPPSVVTAMVDFEERYGGLFYGMPGENGMDHGLEGEMEARETLYGWAFPAIVDGDWTWGVDVLEDGRVAMALSPPIPYQIINRSVEQRLESHALLAVVRSWPHRAFGLTVDTSEIPVIASDELPPVVPEATGPADLWWYDDETAVHLQLGSWWGDHDTWVLRCFAKRLEPLNKILAASRRAATGLPTMERDWCGLCGRRVRLEEICLWQPSAED